MNVLSRSADFSPPRPLPWHPHRSFSFFHFYIWLLVACACSGASKSSLVDRVHEDVSQASSFQAEEGEGLPLEFGKWTSNISCSSFDGIPTIKATENKIIELAPTARGGVGMPAGARGQWTFTLEQAKGIISIARGETLDTAGGNDAEQG